MVRDQGGAILLTSQLFLGQLAILILVAGRECFGKVQAVDKLKAKDGGDHDQVKASHDVVDVVKLFYPTIPK